MVAPSNPGSFVALVNRADVDLSQLDSPLLWWRHFLVGHRQSNAASIALLLGHISSAGPMGWDRLNPNEYGGLRWLTAW
jgi:hypothetical protein